MPERLRSRVCHPWSMVSAIGDGREPVSLIELHTPTLLVRE